MPPAGFEPTILATLRPQTCALDYSVILQNKRKDEKKDK